MAQLEKPAVDVQRPLDPQAALVALRTGLWEDSSALQMVVQDAIRAENYEGSKQWVMQWPTAATLYQSPFASRFWEGTQTERANVPFFTVATATNSIVPQVLNGLFYENPPFMIQQRPGTSAQAARAVGALLAYQLEDINFREELRLGVTNTILFGTGIWKWGWETFTRERKIYRRATDPLTIPSPLAGSPDIQIQDNEEEIEEETTEEYVDRPVFEHIVNLRHVLVDPGLSVPDIRKAKYVIHRQYLTWNQLDKMRDRPGFEIPSKEELLMLFFPPKEEVKAAVSELSARNPLWDARAEARFEDTTADPFNQPLEVLERWDEKQYIVVLQQKLVICNDDNPYGVIPFLSLGWWDVPEAFWSMGLAKAQPLDAKLLTPSGWKLMGDIKVGDRVIGSDGRPHPVSAVYPQGEKEVFRVTFTDGSATECCKEHLWTVTSALSKRPLRRGWKQKTYELQDFCDSLQSSGGASKYFIPLVQPVEFAEQSLPIDPYVTGILLGDGGLTTETPHLASADPEILTEVASKLPSGMVLVNVKGSKYDYRIVSTDRKCNLVMRAARALDMCHRAEAKFVPDIYKFSSVGQRKELLAGLVDSDGTAGKNHCASFTSTSERLIDDVRFLVWSLGGVATKRPSKTKGLPAWRVTIGLPFNPFKLTRKRDRYIPRTKYRPARAFASVEQVGTKPCQCIMVDVADHLYVTDDCILTHNTIGSEQRLQQGITNLWLDNASLNLNGVFVRVRGKSVASQSYRIAPGKIVEVDNKDDFKVMDRLPAVPEAGEHLSLSQQRAEQVSGANEMASQGIAGASGHSNMARSAAGINALTSGAGNRTSDFVEKLAGQVIIPFLYSAHELNRALMPMSTLRYILGEELQHEYIKDKGDLIELLNARVKFSILAASKMQARKNMSQALPILVQFLTNEQTTQQLAIAGYRVDVVEIMRMFFEVSDWKNFNDVVVKMNDQEKQRFMQMQPGAQAQARQQQMLQAQSQQLQQKHQNSMELVDVENIDRAGREVLRHTLETAETPEAVTGEPGQQGFGSSA